MRLWLNVLALIGLIAAVAGCGAGRKPTTPAQEAPQTTLVVDNRGWVDMTIYVLRGTQRMRLGIVPGTSVRRFVIPSTLIFGATPLRFLADPIGSSRTPISNEISVRPGEEVRLLIPYST